MPDEPAAPLNLDEALERDSVASLKREKAELAEKLAAAGSKECPSCRATFEEGRGVTEDGEGKKKPVKKKAAKKKAAEEEGEVKPAKDSEAKNDDEAGFGFFN